MTQQSARSVTTASAIDGWRVDEHLGVVVAHVVAGVGIFSEMFAGFSDFFGGRSESYRRQLGGLYEEAVGQLSRQVQARGGNWLIGLRIDMDEVSGKGTQMFMITALGTAVRASRLEVSGRPKAISNRPVSASDVAVSRRRAALLVEVVAHKLEWDDPVWGFLIESRAEEFAQHAIQWLGRRYSSGGDLDQERRRPAAYFASLPSLSATDVLYNAIEGDLESRWAAVDIIRDLNLLSLERVRACLDAPDAQARIAALRTLESDQQYYGPEDLTSIEALLKAIPPAFPIRSTKGERKGLLGGAKDEWVCSCQTHNAVAITHCTQCACDQRGFRTSDLSPDAAREKLLRLRTALHDLVPSHSQEMPAAAS